MASTSRGYNLRKRSAKRRTVAEVRDDFDLESLLADHERGGVTFHRERGGKKKSRRTVPPPGRIEEVADRSKVTVPPIPFDALPELCIENVYSMLDSPRDLYNLAFLSGRLASLLTPDAVIRSAVFHNLRRRDARSRKLMSSVADNLSNRSIHVPSVRRLLRLLNAKTCERGDECWGRDLLTGRPAELDPAARHRPFGLAVCETCVKFASHIFPYEHFSNFQRGVAFHNCCRVMDPHVDAVTGEIHGPLVRVVQLQQMQSTYKTADDRKGALEIVVARAQAEGGRGTRRETNGGENADAGAGRHVNSVIAFEKRASTMVRIFEKAERDADNFIAGAKRKDYEKKQEWMKLRIAKRSRRLRSIYGKLEDYLSDCRWKDLALNCTWSEGSQYVYNFRFTCKIVGDIMETILSAPASATDKAISDAASRIREVFAVLEDKKFFTYSFLVGSSNRFKKGIYEYCLHELTPVKLMSSYRADMTFLRDVEGNRPTMALLRIIDTRTLGRCFAMSVIRPGEHSESDGDNNRGERIDHYRELAEVVWGKKSNLGTINCWHRSQEFLPLEPAFNASFMANYNVCGEEFRTMKRAAKAYLNSPESREFLRRMPPDDDGNDGGPNRRGGNDEEFTRRDALHHVFSIESTKSLTAWGLTINGINGQIIPYELLLNRDFASLRLVHEAFFQRPRRYRHFLP